MKRFILIFLFFCVLVFAEVDDEDISTSFENSNLTNIADGGTNIIDADLDDKGLTSVAARYCFKVISNYGEQTVTFNIGNYDYPSAINGVISYDDGESWERLSGASVDAGTISFDIAFDNKGSEVLVAVDYYCNYTDYISWCSSIDSETDASVYKFGESVNGRDLNAVIITDLAVDNSRKKTIIIITGQHPYEPISVFVVRRIMEYLLTDTPFTNNLRKRYRWIFMPMLNPDGFYSGYQRHNANDADLNREWEDGDRSEPEILAAWNYIEKIYPEPVYFFDFHGICGGDYLYCLSPELIKYKTVYLKQSKMYRSLFYYTDFSSNDLEIRTAADEALSYGSMNINKYWPANLLEMPMLTDPMTMQEVADQAKGIVKAINAFCLRD